MPTVTVLVMEAAAVGLTGTPVVVLVAVVELSVADACVEEDVASVAVVVVGVVCPSVALT